MQQPAIRPWVTAGVAVTAAGLVAAAPVAAPTLPSGTADVQLTDFVGLTADNITNLVDYFAGAQPGYFLIDRVPVGAPLPILQQIATNSINNLGTVLNDPGQIGTVVTSMFDNLGAGLRAPFGPFADALATGGPLEVTGLGSAVNSAVEALIRTVLGIPDLSRASLLDGIMGLDLTGLLGLDPSLEGLVNGLLSFTGSAAGGVLLGALGPVLGPGMVLVNGLGEVFGGDTAALRDIPGNMVNAFLNGGQTLDLMPLLELLGVDPSVDIDLGVLGSVTGGLDDLGLELGGVLGGPGSIFNALTVDAGLDYYAPCVIGCPRPPISGGAEMTGGDAGPIGSLLALRNSIADAINPGVGPYYGLLPYDGLLPTITTGLGLDQVSDVFNDIQAFLVTNLLDPATGFLTANLVDPLSDAITGLLGSDLGVAALSDMTLDIPYVLLAMML